SQCTIGTPSRSARASISAITGPRPGRSEVRYAATWSARIVIWRGPARGAPCRFALGWGPCTPGRRRGRRAGECGRFRTAAGHARGHACWPRRRMPRPEAERRMEPWMDQARGAAAGAQVGEPPGQVRLDRRVRRLEVAVHQLVGIREEVVQLALPIRVLGVEPA